jgi:hypothetical protein
LSEDFDDGPVLIGLLKEMLRDPDGPDAFVERLRAESAANYAEFERQYFEEHAGHVDEAAPMPQRSRWMRRPSVERFIKDARNAGEKGVVRVTVTDPNGFTVTVSSGDQEQASDGTFANPWDEVTKRATH